MRRSLAAVLLAALFAQAALAGPGDSASARNRAGNRLYSKSRYDEALAQYRAAQVVAPELLELFFNAGDALYRKGDLENAVREFSKAAASTDARLAADASYNAGNAMLAMGRPDQAIEAYKAALKRDPDHGDAKHNLELALMLLEQQEQQQQEQQDRQDQQDQKDQQGQQGQQDQQGERDEQDERDQQGAESEPQEQGTDEQQPQRRQAGMTEEDAARLLDAIDERERELQAELRAAQARKRAKVDKDW